MAFRPTKQAFLSSGFFFVHIKPLTYAHFLPWSPSPRALHQTAWQRLSGCGWCNMCVSLPPRASRVTSVPADLLPAELRRARGCLSLLFTLLGRTFRAFASGGILLRYFFERHYQAEAFPHKSNIVPIWISLCLWWAFMFFFVSCRWMSLWNTLSCIKLKFEWGLLGLGDPSMSGNSSKPGLGCLLYGVGLIFAQLMSHQHTHISPLSFVLLWRSHMLQIRRHIWKYVHVCGAFCSSFR